MHWETVIGLEIHVQLLTKTKIFSGAENRYGAAPNSLACGVDLALPGTLPVLNQEAVRMAILFGLSVGGEIADHSVFERKHYFYPDLPKGYQITQNAQPIIKKGSLSIVLEDGSTKIIPMHHTHLEDDAGKSLHEDFHGHSGIDLNRAGTPLLEIVSEPAMSSAKEAVAYLKGIHTLVRYLNICDGNMQEGSFRCDANISVRPAGETQLGTRTEVKNVNSFRFVERAINFEVARHIDVLEAGQTITQQTLLFDPDKNETRPLRNKEDAKDYRYFPDPDLLPIKITQAEIDEVRKQLPELPTEKRHRFEHDFQLSAYDADILVRQVSLADYFEAVLAAQPISPKTAANWIIGDVLAGLKKANLTVRASPISAEQLAGLIARIEDQTISGKMAKQVFEALWCSDQTVDAVIKAQGLEQITNPDEISRLVDDIMAQFPNQLADYRSGKDKLFAFFVGQIMKASQGKASPEVVNALLKEKL